MIIRIFLPLLLLGAIIGFQYSFDIQKNERLKILLNLIPAQAIKLGDLGLHSGASVTMWIYAIQQVTAYPDKLLDLIAIVNELDPKFSYPYAFSALVIPSLGFPEKGIKIAEQGIERADQDWRIPYYLATAYHIFLKDRKNASLYFDMAARMSDAPETIKSMAVRYGTSALARDQEKEIWTSIYETTTDDFVKERAKNYIIQIEILKILEKAVALYKQKFGYYPKKIENLVQPGILKAVPPSPFGLEYSIDKAGKAKLSSN